MNCNQLQDLYSNFFEGDLSDSERIAFEQHLTACSGCREDYHVFAQVFRVLDATAAADVEVPSGFRAGVLARIAAGQSQPAPGFLDWFRSNFLLPKGVLYGGFAALAACLVLVACLLATGTGSSKQQATTVGIGQISPIAGPTLQTVSSQQGTDGLTYEVFTLHLPQDVSTSVVVDADIVQNATALTEPTGQDAPGQTPAWDGTLEPETALQIPVAATSEVPAGATLNMLLRWRPVDNSRPEQRELAFVPVNPKASGEPVPQIAAGASFYDAVQAISAFYGVPVTADPSALYALTTPRPLGALTGSEADANAALKAVLGPAHFLVTQNSDGSLTLSHA